MNGQSFAVALSFTACMVFPFGRIAIGQASSSERPTLEQLAQQLQDAGKRGIADNRYLPDYDGGGLSWFRAQYVEGEALRQLGREVEGHPDHPDRLLWDESMRRQRGEPYGALQRIWADGPDRWRINTTIWQLNEEHYFDGVVYPGREWMLTRDGLTIFRPGVAPASYSDVRSFRSGVMYDLSWLLLGRLDLLSNDNISLEGLRWLDGDRFAFRLVRGRPGDGKWYVMAYEARWDREAGRWFIESAEILEHENRAAEAGSRYEFDGWVFAPEIGWWVAGRIERAGGDRPNRLLEFRGAHEGDDDELERITRIPPADGADPLRGALNVRRVTDHREGQVKKLGPGGESVSLRAIEEQEKLPYVRIAGLLVLVGGASALVFTVWKRFR